MLFALLVILLVQSNEGAKILGFFPTPSLSHQVVFRPLMHELARIGHQVTVVTPDPAFPKGKAPKNLTEIDVHEVSYDIAIKMFYNQPRGKKEHFFPLMASTFKIFPPLFEVQVKNEEFQEVLKKQSFDLVIVESMSRASLVFGHIFKAPVIQMSSLDAYFGNYEYVGAEIHQILYPAPWRLKLYNLTLWEKIRELFYSYTLKYLQESAIEEDDEVIKKLFGPDIPSMKELTNRVDMLFLNVHPLFGDNRPVPPSVLYMGGIYQARATKVLPKDLKTYLDNSKNGVIYMSFGTNVQPELLPPEWIQIFVSVLSNLPYDVLWKWNTDETPAKSANIRFEKWLPQADLLKHPKVKLFITQGGLQSTEEAIYSEVPLLGIPMLGDQWYNTEKYDHFKIGKQLLVEDLCENSFRDAVMTIVQDDSYRKNIQDLHMKFTDQPRSPLENAVWWTEHVLRHGGASHLRSPAANLSASQYYELKLLGVLAAIVLTAVGIILGTIYLVLKKIFGKSKLKVKKQ